MLLLNIRLIVAFAHIRVADKTKFEGAEQLKLLNLHGNTTLILSTSSCVG